MEIVTFERPGDSSDSPLLPFCRTVLPNGLTVFVKEVHTVPLVAAYFWVGVGAVDERPERAGLAHFSEHMLFKGTRRRDVGEMDRIIKSLGGYDNAFTTPEYTAYYAVVPGGNFSLVFDVLFDAMVNSVFDPEEIEREREVVMEEIRRQEDSPEEKLSDMFTSELLKGTPYERPVLGTIDTVTAIQREDFLAYMSAFYIPNNTVVSVAGDVDARAVVEQIARATSDWTPDASLHRTFDFSPQEEIRRRTAERDVHHGYWVLGFPNLGRRDMDTMYILDVASTILGGGRSSRLHQRLVEREGLASSASAWIWPLRRAGAFGIDADFRDEHLSAMEHAVLEEVERMRTEPVIEEELSRAKTMLKAEYLYENETVSDIAGTLGKSELLLSVQDALIYPEKIDRVTSEEIRRAMAETCDPNVYTVCYLRPRQ